MFDPSTAHDVSAMCLTPARAGSIQLASDEVHCWCARLDVPPETSARLYATLGADEHDRSARFRFQRDRQHFIVSHGVLRDLLGRYLQIQPHRIRYDYGVFGKPELCPTFGGGIQFSLSHADGLALIAIAAGSKVGVDLEGIQSQVDYMAIARQFFSTSETEELSALPSRSYAEAFISCWTKKEACLKACGGGLAIPLNRLAVPLQTDPAEDPIDVHVAAHDVIPETRCSVYTLRPAPCYVGALAIEGSGFRLAQRQWEMPQA